MRLAELARAAELRAVWIPDPADEAIRDLARAREDAVNARTQLRQQLKGFLLRHDVRYAGRTAWSKTYYRWLATLNFGEAAAQTAFTELWQAVSTADARVPAHDGAGAVDRRLALRAGGDGTAGAARHRSGERDRPR